jgi:solute carrier family 35 protein F5
MASSEALATAGDISQGGDVARIRPSVTLSISDRISSSLVSRRSSVGAGPEVGVWHVARRTLGISLLLVTVFLWTASNFLASVSIIAVNGITCPNVT